MKDMFFSPAIGLWFDMMKKESTGIQHVVPINWYTVVVCWLTCTLFFFTVQLRTSLIIICSNNSTIDKCTFYHLSLVVVCYRFQDHIEMLADK